MDNYSKVLTFFMENGVQLTTEQLEALKEEFQKFDKASWQIEGGIPSNKVIKHFKFMYKWLNNKGLLSKDGEEIYKSGIDESSIITSEQLTLDGSEFMKKYYDKYLNSTEYGVKEDEKLLDQFYKEFNK